MNIKIFSSASEASNFVAKTYSELLVEKPSAILGLATGRTPCLTYKCMIEEFKKGIDFSKCTTFNLDEFVGVAPEHPLSFRSTMNEIFFDHININKNKTFLPNGTAENMEAEALRYEENITSCGGIDLQLLGIGGNGHIGFNEPETAFDSKTTIIDLTEGTRNQYSAPFGSLDKVPTQGITMGISTIMQSKQIILLALGKEKAEIIKSALKGEITESVPASILQKHKNLIVVLDQEAASLL